VVDAFDALLATLDARLTPLETGMPVRVRDASACPATLLAHLAWSRGLDYWSSAWPEVNKRELIRQTPANLRRRGTRAAIDSAAGAFDAAIDITEWWEEAPAGIPGTATASVDGDGPIGQSAEGQDTLRSILEREGRASIHWTVQVGLVTAGRLAITGAVRAGVLHRVEGVQRGA
jgi:phage tail P2-like protein